MENPTHALIPQVGVLVLAAIGDGRIALSDRLAQATTGHYSFVATTPLGFFHDEVLLFWSLLIQELDLKAQFPLRLAPETEQELATQVWRADLDQVIAEQPGIVESRLVRRILDVLQLAMLAGVPMGDIPAILAEGLAGQSVELPLPFDRLGEMLVGWQAWCLERGLLTYSLIAGLYWQHLLPHPLYQQQLRRRYGALVADDVDEYPAIARLLFDVLLDAGAAAIFTYNPDGAVRLGLGADPGALVHVADRCQVELLADPVNPVLGSTSPEAIAQFILDPLLLDPLALPQLPAAFRMIQTTSRAQLLRQTTDVVIAAIQAGEMAPRDIAIIGPGLDAIARYSLIEILTKQGIPVESLNDQRPLNSVPIIRALLTLLTLVYSGLGRLCDRDAVAEMLVLLSGTSGGSSPFMIDPVRAGLLADHCFVPHPDRPRLLPVTTFPRWDRLGYQTAGAYEDLLQWIAAQQGQLEQRLIPNAIALLDRAIQHFLGGGSTLPFDQLAALRQLMETAQHYWEVHGRLERSSKNRSDPNNRSHNSPNTGPDSSPERGPAGEPERGIRGEVPAFVTVGRLIGLLRSGTVTANPYPVRPIGPAGNAVTLATVFQYRSSRRFHRWQFWLDAGSGRWLTGVDALFAAPLFLHSWSGRVWTAADTLDANEQRLRRILIDLLGRAGERIYLCHSDLATGGQEQTGVLLSLVNAVES
jgi:hypothetical protein